MRLGVEHRLLAAVPVIATPARPLELLGQRAVPGRLLDARFDVRVRMADRVVARRPDPEVNLGVDPFGQRISTVAFPGGSVPSAAALRRDGFIRRGSIMTTGAMTPAGASIVVSLNTVPTSSPCGADLSAPHLP
jgi:hypothetical protein